MFGQDIDNIRCQEEREQHESRYRWLTWHGLTHDRGSTNMGRTSHTGREFKQNLVLIIKAIYWITSFLDFSLHKQKQRRINKVSTEFIFCMGVEIVWRVLQIWRWQTWTWRQWGRRRLRSRWRSVRGARAWRGQWRWGWGQPRWGRGPGRSWPGEWRGAPGPGPGKRRLSADKAVIHPVEIEAISLDNSLSCL